jgi:hypothetical protein
MQAGVLRRPAQSCHGPARVSRSTCYRHCVGGSVDAGVCLQRVVGIGLVAGAVSSCSLVFGIHDNDGPLDGSMTDAVADGRATEGGADGGAPEAFADGGVDVVDVQDAPLEAHEEASDPCATTIDPCSTIMGDNGGCYCAASSQSGFDTSVAKANCIYRCASANGAPPFTTDQTKYCNSGCTVAKNGVEDYCVGSQPCDASVAKCYQTCAQ